MRLVAVLQLLANKLGTRPFFIVARAFFLLTITASLSACQSSQSPTTTGLGTRVAASCSPVGPRVDCGYLGIDKTECENRGCCWSPATFEDFPAVDLPWCFTPNDHPSTYTVENSSSKLHCSSFSTENGKPCCNQEIQHLNLSSKQSTLPELGADVSPLSLFIHRYKESSVAINGGCRSRDKGIIRLRLTSGNGAPKRWQVPSFLYPADSIAGGGGGGGGDQVSNVLISDVHEVTINHTVDPFELLISYHQGGNQITIWNSSELRLVFKDQYLEWSTWLDPNVTLYGAGERSSKNFHLIRQGAPRTLWNHDLGPTFVEQNSYGSHPFTMALSPDGSHAWGYFLLNSNAMDIIPASDRLSWRVTGGELDFFILVGPTPADVMDQFTQVIGRPAFMPYWSLGWHQCKYGYRSIWEVEQVVDNYSRAGIPLEAAWTDIDHMSRWKDFTFDEKEFPIDEMRRFVQRLEKNNQRWVPIFDPGIKTEPGYTPYERGLAEDVFIKSYDAKQPTKPYLGWVWPGPAVYPDFLHPRGRRYFQSFLAEHHAQVKWGGAWIDMDEAANFCTGDACFPKDNSASLHKLRDDPDPPPWVCDLNCSVDLRPELNTTWRKLLDPPYAVSNSLSRLPLGTKVISVIATHLDGSLQYNTHNLYGLAHAMTVYEGMKEIMVGKRPFILTRSSFSGTGAYAAHWTGDNAATWDDLAMSIPAVLSYGIFGMPMGGADVCGFGGNTTEELCARWVALAALAYPFARSHADIHSSRQEPYLWESVARTARTTLGFRYSILPYLYTLHKVAHETGTPVAQPLWFHHAHDVKTHTLDRQVMMGPAFLVTPVLRPGVTRVTGYLPNINGSWYEVKPGLGGASSDHIPTAIQGGVTVESDAPMDWIPVHMRGGHIVPFQVSGMTTLQVRKSDLTIVAALKRPIENLAGDGVQEAAGRMYHDDGESFSNGFDDSAQGLGCSWMEFHLTVDSSRGVHKAEMVVGFKSFTPPPCADGASVGVAWPKLAPIKVLGWSIPAENVTFSTITKAGAKRVGWANAKVEVKAGGVLMLRIPKGVRQLDCCTGPYGLKVRWTSFERPPHAVAFDVSALSAE